MLQLYSNFNSNKRIQLVFISLAIYVAAVSGQLIQRLAERTTMTSCSSPRLLSVAAAG